MASWSEGRLQDPRYRRYILAGLALEFLCKTLDPYLQHVIKDLHGDLTQNGHTKPDLCGHSNLTTYKTVKDCLQLSCGSSVRLLDGLHVTGSIHQGWRNSQIELWESQPWSVALLYMDPGKDPTTNLGPGDTDISGTLNLMERCTQFKVDKTHVKLVREKRNFLVHRSTYCKLEEAEFIIVIDEIKSVLLDPYVTRHVDGNAVQHLDDMKNMTFDITFHDELTVFKRMLENIEERSEQRFIDFITKFEDLSKAFSEYKLKQKAPLMHLHNTTVIEDKTATGSHVNVEVTTDCIGHCQQIKRRKITQEEESLLENIETTTQTTTGLQKDLRECYSRPEFTNLNSLLDDDTFGYVIESVFVEVSLQEREIKVILGKHGLEDSMQKKGKTVDNVNDMIPPCGGHRVLMTGFVGSGKTSLCLHWVREWRTNIKTNRTTKNNIHEYELVIFLRARELEISVSQSLSNKLDGRHSQEREEHIHKCLFEKPATLIIIDGYDEADNAQKAIVEEIVSYKKLPHASIIITSRPNFFHGKVNKWYDNLGFSKEQQIKFVDRFNSMLNDKEQQYFKEFKEQFASNKNASNLFTSPMMAMTTCTMVAAGEEISFDSRVKNYEQVTEYLARRACFKSEKVITIEQFTPVMPDLRKAAFCQMLEQKSFRFSRDDIIKYINPDTLDNIIVHLGYLSVTKYILSSKTDTAYAFVHKSWAEFTAAKYVMSLPIAIRCTAVCDLFKSGPANLEVIRFVLGLCCQDVPDHCVLLFKAVVKYLDTSGTEDKMKIVLPSQVIDDEVVQKLKLETIVAQDIADGAAYLLMLLADVDLSKLTSTVLCELSQICVSVWESKIMAETVGARIQQDINVSPQDKWPARALYANLLLKTHDAQDSLHTVREVKWECVSNSPHCIVNGLPTALAACAPRMTALTCVEVGGLVSSKELCEVCSGLVDSGLHCFTNLMLSGGFGTSLEKMVGGELGPVAQVITASTKLTDLNLQRIHAGEEKQLSKLCAAVRNDTTSLKRLVLGSCSLSTSLCYEILLPALHGRLTSCGAKLVVVELWGVSGTEEEISKLEVVLKGVAEKVTAV